LAFVEKNAGRQFLPASGWGSFQRERDGNGIGHSSSPRDGSDWGSVGETSSASRRENPQKRTQAIQGWLAPTSRAELTVQMASIAELTTAPALDLSTMSSGPKARRLVNHPWTGKRSSNLEVFECRGFGYGFGEMANLPVITEKLRLEVLREMSEIAMVATTSLRGGMEFTQAALEKAVGSYKATAIMSRVSANPVPQISCNVWIKWSQGTSLI